MHSPNNQTLINLKKLPEARQYFVAFSGGMDSTALLHVLSNSPYKSKLVAIHVNHNINDNAKLWQQHCHAFCHDRGIKFITESVTPHSLSENDLRSARLNVFDQHLKPDDCLLTGHHQSDQAETILFRLIRGTGLLGMTAIEPLSKQFKYRVYRPLLSTSKNDIQQYISSHCLSYVNDPSNDNDQYSRNFIRNQMVPIINQYQSDGIQQICLTANNLKQSLALLSDLVGKTNPIKVQAHTKPNQLATFIYHWLHNLGLRSPSHKRLLQFSADSMQSSHDKQTELITDGYKLQCWKKQIYALKLITPPSTKELRLQLTTNKPIELPYMTGQLIMTGNHSASFNATIKFCQTSEVILLKGHKHRQKIKKLFQSHAIPPWERLVIPYLYIDNELMAVGSYFVSQKFNLLLDELNTEYEWLSPQFLL
ncbi:tRNA lysidine(34) synthetase TilS [Marinicella litoralis]|uniref:tRNA lysidine(34) synthetase TilS n=1 Tax=Marinicella litoralis TaxID=644220 RepID=UPI0013C340CF|nr:tRNA lysidine(34) synthetase TilS [Marinicella litoralis]